MLDLVWIWCFINFLSFRSLKKEKQISRVMDLWSLLPFVIRASCMDEQEHCNVVAIQPIANKIYDLWVATFGVGTCSYNVHMLHHMQHFYDTRGPFPNWSAFPFEGSYSYIRKKLTGSRNPAKQVIQEVHSKYLSTQKHRY